MPTPFVPKSQSKFLKTFSSDFMDLMRELAHKKNPSQVRPLLKHANFPLIREHMSKYKDLHDLEQKQYNNYIDLAAQGVAALLQEYE